MSFLIAPIVGAPNILNLLGWPTWTIGHLFFGLVLGFWPVLRPQDFTDLIGRRVRQSTSYEHASLMPDGRISYERRQKRQGLLLVACTWSQPQSIMFSA
jgi:hypothetical protein